MKLLIAAAKAHSEGRTLADLIAPLRAPKEARELRIKIEGADDVKAYGTKVLAAFEQRVRDAGLSIAAPSYEGVRVVFPDGWALLRISLHDPNMPLNIESDAEGGADEIERRVKSLLFGFENLNFSCFSV